MYEDMKTPAVGVEQRTLLWDVEADRQVMWFEAVLPLPVGAVVQLADGSHHGTAHVTGVTLLPGKDERSAGGALLRLDCTVDAGWWEHHTENEEYRQAAEGVFPSPSPDMI